MKIKKKIATLLAVLILLTAMPLLGGTKIYDEKMIAAESIATALFEEATDGVSQVVYSYDLRGLDGEKDFILVTGQYSGYAIFTREDLSLIEYSPYGNSPYSGLDKSQSRYAGPASYYVEEGTGVKNINTKEIVKKENLTVIADKVRTKSSIGTVELPVVKEEVSTMSMGGVSTMSAGAGGADVKDANEYYYVDGKLISDYGYFLSDPYHGYNGSGTCVTVATQLLLSYNNWSKFAKLIDESEFLLKSSNQVSPLQPYHRDNVSTTEALYNYLLSKIDPEMDGADMNEAASGIGDFILEFVEQNYWQLFTSSHSLNSSIVVDRIKNEIDNDRPLIVTMDNYETLGNGSISVTPHAVVVYGYQTFRIEGVDVDGYICHMGWSGDYYHYCWFNEDWLNGGYLTFEVNHTHNDSISLNSHIMQCSTCLRIKATDAHNYNQYEIKQQINYEIQTVQGITTKATKNDLKHHYKVCDCGNKKPERHNFQYIDNRDFTHSFKCVDCGVVVIKEAHKYKYPGYSSFCLLCSYGNGVEYD